MKRILAFFLVLFFCEANCHIDFEEMTQDFVLETKQLFIPGYKDAFNPSIVKWKDAYLLSFRFRDPLTKSTNQVGFIYLDANFNPVGTATVLEQRYYNADRLWMQDPRLITINNVLYIVYNNIGELSNPHMRRMFVAELKENDHHFYVESPQSLLNYEGMDEKRHEKNWSPFEFNASLMLIYSLTPHTILKPMGCSSNCKLISNTDNKTSWEWGTLRGGTPATLENGFYLSFFHSCCQIPSFYSEGRVRDHYFMGAYTFSAKPPFEILTLSPSPIIGKNFYRGPLHPTWKPLHVVFPGGHISDEKFIWIAYGRQDHESWIVKLDKNKLLQSLVPVY